MILVNGKVENSIAVADRGLQYGDGLFETIEVIDGKPLFLKQHLLRLNTGCMVLKLPKPEPRQIDEEIRQVCQNAAKAVLKIIITRGASGRGYKIPDTMQPSRIVSLHPALEYPNDWIISGIGLRYCETRLGTNPALAGLKHLNRLEQVMARSEWDDPSIQEGLMLDSNGRVIEGTMSNLFMVKNGVFHTPKLEQAGVAGVMRGILIKTITEQKLSLLICDIKRHDLASADEIFICNSLIGIWPVTQLENKRYEVGGLTRQLLTHLKQLKQNEIR